MLIELSAQRTKQIAQNNIQCKLKLTILFLFRYIWVLRNVCALLLQIAWNAALNMINISILTKHTCQNFKLIRNKNQNKKSIFKCVFITKIHSNVQNRSKKTINIGSGMNAKQRERPKKLAIECWLNEGHHGTMIVMNLFAMRHVNLWFHHRKWTETKITLSYRWFHNRTV